eukprot:CAMPEP_0184658310 /NCGR_PEP_ID=MMETSP0308-20130426/24858_1 /TAXON_ID=38269 /ORGANISM="Gloeochaete witrockiana, Strain SAG 46.84" /LENGTH=108 /DNA_ID=CAMNT_0027097219 /DNA_START=15 /DNA_END=338 /DNA_ORIENTATION=-
MATSAPEVTHKRTFDAHAFEVHELPASSSPLATAPVITGVALGTGGVLAYGFYNFIKGGNAAKTQAGFKWRIRLQAMTVGAMLIFGIYKGWENHQDLKEKSATKKKEL